MTWKKSLTDAVYKIANVEHEHDQSYLCNMKVFENRTPMPKYN